MASFQAKIGWKRLRKRENKTCHSIPFLPNAYEEIIKKQQKNSKNSIIPLLISFDAKIGWRRSKKRENKNYRAIPFLAVGLAKIPQKEQKNSKN